MRDQQRRGPAEATAQQELAPCVWARQEAQGRACDSHGVRGPSVVTLPGVRQAQAVLPWEGQSSSLLGEEGWHRLFAGPLSQPRCGPAPLGSLGGPAGRRGPMCSPACALAPPRPLPLVTQASLPGGGQRAKGRVDVGSQVLVMAAARPEWGWDRQSHSRHWDTYPHRALLMCRPRALAGPPGAQGH